MGKIELDDVDYEAEEFDDCYISTLSLQIIVPKNKSKKLHRMDRDYLGKKLVKFLNKLIRF